MIVPTGEVKVEDVLQACGWAYDLFVRLLLSRSWMQVRRVQRQTHCRQAIIHLGVFNWLVVDPRNHFLDLFHLEFTDPLVESLRVADSL